MKGILLAGGLGTRMHYYTHRVSNKHLIYVYNRAMIEYPLVSLVEAGIKDAVVVTGGRHSGGILSYLGDGKEFGLNSLNYGYQHKEGGIADALRCAKPFCKGSRFVSYWAITCSRIRLHLGYLHTKAEVVYFLKVYPILLRLGSLL